MEDLDFLLKPVWRAQKYITPIWNSLTDEERDFITIRMDDLFKDGLPFELKHEKMIYLHVFSFFVQVELMACQVPLKTESKMVSVELQKRMRAQLLDEVFHVLLSIKIVYLLSTPLAYPPEHNENLDILCDFIRNEACPKMAVTLLNLMSEGIAEELVKCLDKVGFAPRVFGIILEDESRHVSDADLYYAIELPEKNQLKLKVCEFEAHLSSGCLFQYNLGMSLIRVFGLSGMHEFICNMNDKYKQQLCKLDLIPGDRWNSLMQILTRFSSHPEAASTSFQEIPKTPMRRWTMSQWNDPVDPTMVGHFNIDVTCLDFFNKKYPSDTLTILSLQTLSKLLYDHPEYQLFLRDEKLYQRQSARVCLVVQLPGCGDHLGVITFQDCHNTPVNALSARINQIISMMVYCYQKREQLEKDYPYLISLDARFISEVKQTLFSSISSGIPGISLSNIGIYGYTQASSPLFPNEASKVTLLEVQRTPVWNKITNAFEPRDLLPVSVSSDHRILGANTPFPKIMNRLFQTVFERMEQNSSGALLGLGDKIKNIKNQIDNSIMSKKLDYLLNSNPEFGYIMLSLLHTMWPDYMNIDEVLANFSNIKINLSKKTEYA